MERILLSGYTPAPLDRFGRPRKDFAKVALGAERTVPWERTENLLETLAWLKREGYVCVAFEQSPQSVEYRAFKALDQMVVLFGNEVEGLSPALLAEADHVLHIPMSGTKESLNVEVAAGIGLFHLAAPREQ